MFSSENWFGASPSFYNAVATQSLRFDDGSSAFLTRTPSSASNRKTFTWSGWVKRGNITLSASQMFFTARTVGNGTYTLLFFEGSTDYLYLLDNNCTLRTTSVYRDVSSWYHIVLAVDTTQATDSNRLKLYVNGIQITDFVTATYPSQNTDLNVNSTATHFIGKQENTQYLDGYLAEVNFVDGQSLKPEAFAETKNGVWIPKKYETKPSLIAQGTGTAIGDMTNGGGLAGAFNGTQFQSYASSAQQTSSQATSFIGKNWGTSKTVTGFILYSNTQYGFVGSGASSFTVKLYGKNGAPSNATDGTLLFTSSAVTDANSRGAIRYFADTNIQSEETISSFTTTTAFTYHWVVITPNTSEGAYVSEIEFYENGSTYYGTNGFRLEFNASGLNTSSGAVTTPTNIGDDSSGNNNHLTPTNIVASDCNMPDSPENNFATGNPLIPIPSGSLSEGNLAYVRGSEASHGNCGTTFALPTTGKWYWEVMSGKSANNETIGVANILDHNPQLPQTGDHVGQRTGDYVYRTNALKMSGTNVAGGSSYGATYTGGDVIGVAWSSDDGTITFYKNNASQGIAYSSITQAEGKYVPAVSQAETSSETVFNFGQDSSFAGHKTAQGNTDGNGNGDFYYSPPSSYLALCASNLPEPVIGANSDTQPNNHFNTVKYDTNNQNAKTVTGMGIRPDWLWIKGRGLADHHALFNSNRGVNKFFRSSGNDDEFTDATLVTAFNDDGFVLGTDGFGWVNYGSNTMVAWGWVAGGTTPTKTYKVKVVADSTDFGHGTGSNKYQFFKSDGSTGFGTNGVDLDLQEGGTYTFDWSDSSAQSHPIRFSLTNDGTHSSGTSAGSEYTTGVVKDDSAYLTTITIASGVANLYYYCQSHSGMGAEIRTNETHGSTNFDGSLLSVSNTNTTAGFSIITSTSPSSGTWSVGHGLNSTPDFIIQKYSSAGTRWTVWHNTLTSGQYLGLNETTQVQSSGTPFNFTFNDTVIGGNADYEATSKEVLYFAFNEVEGYSKFGVYTANGLADGNFVYTGFRPAWLMIRKTDGSGATWWIVDAVRDIDNPVAKYLMSDSPNQESNGSDYTTADFLSNGFKIRNTSTAFNSGTHIYICFAESPFKYANAR